MLVVSKGQVSHTNVKPNIISNIERGVLPHVKSIVIHRTAGSTAESTLNTWKTKKTGAHFLIAKDGTIYQTAGLDKQCWHMGLVMSKCRLENTCTEEDLKIIKGFLYGPGKWKSRYTKILSHERKKNYPDRFPMNSDSIGVELVGLYLGTGDKGPFENLTKAQLNSFLWLMTELLEKYNLKLDKDVYAHGAVARKKVKEGVAAFDWLKENYK